MNLTIFLPYFTFTIFIFLMLYLFTYFKPEKMFFTKADIGIQIIKHSFTNTSISFPMKIREKEQYRKDKIRNFHVPKYMIDLYKKLQENTSNENVRYADVIKSIIPKSTGSIYYGQSIIDNNFINNQLLIFELPKTTNEEILIIVELRILILLNANNDVENGIENIVHLSYFNDEDEKQISLEKKHSLHTKNSWISFNLTYPVIELLTKKQKTFKAILTIETLTAEKENNIKLSLFPETEYYQHDYPFLLFYYKSKNKNRKKYDKENINIFYPDKFFGDNGYDGNSHGRSKRSLLDDYEEETNIVWDDRISKKRMRKMKNACKRKSLYIDFEEIGYDSWIVQPSGYEAYQCSGRCGHPLAAHLTPTAHAVVQALLAAKRRAQRPCCVPTVLGDVSLLYIDTRGVLTYRHAYRDLVVEECGCR